MQAMLLLLDPKSGTPPFLDICARSSVAHGSTSSSKTFTWVDFHGCVGWLLGDHREQDERARQEIAERAALEAKRARVLEDMNRRQGRLKRLQRDEGYAVWRSRRRWITGRRSAD